MGKVKEEKRDEEVLGEGERHGEKEGGRGGGEEGGKLEEEKTRTKVGGGKEASSTTNSHCDVDGDVAVASINSHREVEGEVAAVATVNSHHEVERDVAVAWRKEEERGENVHDKDVWPGEKDRMGGGGEEEGRIRRRNEETKVGGATNVNEETVSNIETVIAKRGRGKCPRLHQQALLRPQTGTHPMTRRRMVM